MSSSPLRPGASLEEELNYYKKQYEQLETDLSDFQASSKELEEQLERDIEAAEKNERKLKEQIEKLKYETEEWKTKHRQSKLESNNAQNILQKEITTMRDTNRTLQLKLRDTEVMNDDFERQARNTESSLEDLESKYNVTIERGVLMEEEVKNGEQEREALRIETQRLRDELGDLKVENEITLAKLRQADDTIGKLRSRKPSPLAVQSLRTRSPASEASGITAPSPTASTPPPKSDTASEVATPPSPPLSDAPTNEKLDPKTPIPARRRSLIPDASMTPRAGLAPRTAANHSRGPSTASSTTSEAKHMKPPARPRVVSRPSNLSTEGLPRSDSLYQIRSLRGRMQKIEERVHSARSKLPASKCTPPRNSPRAAPAFADTLPTSITMRRSIKRPSNIGSQADAASDVASETPSSRRQSGISRLSFGIPRPPSVADRPASAMGRPSSALGRPPSAMGRPPSALDRPPSAMERPPSAAAAGRPSSRTSLFSGSASVSGHRPSSRAGTETSLGLHVGLNGVSSPTNKTSTSGVGHARSNSSLGGKYATMHGTPRSHRPSASISEVRRVTAESEDPQFRTGASRRSTLDRTAMFTPPSKPHSGGLSQPKTLARRTSTGFGQGKSDGGTMRPPPRRKMSDVGETY